MGQSTELAYVGLEVSDRDAFGTYLSEVLGLVAGDSVADAQTWRMDGKSHRFLVHCGPADDVRYLGYQVPDEGAFDQAVARLESTGTQVIEGTDQDLAERRVSHLAWATAPWGTRIEIVRGLADATDPFESGLVPGGFVTEDLGLGHAVLMFPAATPEGRDAFEQAASFTEKGLGMVLSDRLQTELDGMPVGGNFYHCNGRHHSMALLAIPAPVLPRVLNHVMIETVSADNVGHAYDRALAAGTPIAMGLGKHPNDRMFSFYGTTPAGFEIEVGTDGVIVDDDWPVLTYDQISAWGHHPETAHAHAH